MSKNQVYSFTKLLFRVFFLEGGGRWSGREARTAEGFSRKNVVFYGPVTVFRPSNHPQVQELEIKVGVYNGCKLLNITNVLRIEG